MGCQREKEAVKGRNRTLCRVVLTDTRTTHNVAIYRVSDRGGQDCCPVNFAADSSALEKQFQKNYQ